MNNQFLNILGLCRKAGRLSLGHDAAKLAIKAGRAKLCIVCKDASERLKDEMNGITESEKVRTIYTDFSMADIQRALSFKAAVMTADDEGFAKLLISKFNDGQSGEERGL